MFMPREQPFGRRSAVTGLLLLAVAIAVLAAGCRTALPHAQFDIGGADAERGRVAFMEYGCHSCHTIPGVTRANAQVGPPLDGWSDRSYIAGRLPNTPSNLIAWIMSPQIIDPGNAMPDVGVPEVIARDMAAYLYTLGEQLRR
jgi:cytochrome c